MKTAWAVTMNITPKSQTGKDGFWGFFRGLGIYN